MNEMLEEKREALQVAGNYLNKLIPGMRELCDELRGNRKEDTDEFMNQCLDGLNWIIEIYNRTSDLINDGTLKISKNSVNSFIENLSLAVRCKNDAKIADVIEEGILPFLRQLTVVIGEKIEGIVG